MFTSKQLQEIKQHLEKAGNPLFFFDNDVDGLCSFLLLARAYGRGKGVAIKSFPDLNQTYARKLHELKPDYVFILDKPIISQGFIEEARNLNLPVVWIDHHDVRNSVLISDHPENQKDFPDVEVDNFEGVSYYNPSKNDEKSFEPVTYLSYQVSGKKEDLWLALCGCIGDNFLPDFAEDFGKNYPELWKEKIRTAFQALYETDIGKVSRILSFGLKDRTSNVVKMLKFLLKVKSPLEILKDDRNQMIFRFNQVNKKYQKLIEKAGKFVKDKIIYFQYGGELSLSADIANELSYRFPSRIVIVAYIKGTKANISLRGKNARDLTLKAIEGLEGATGGGHEEATGCKINISDLEKFKERIEKLV